MHLEAWVSIRSHFGQSKMKCLNTEDIFKPTQKQINIRLFCLFVLSSVFHFLFITHALVTITCSVLNPGCGAVIMLLQNL